MDVRKCKMLRNEKKRETNLLVKQILNRKWKVCQACFFMVLWMQTYMYTGNTCDQLNQCFHLRIAYGASSKKMENKAVLIFSRYLFYWVVVVCQYHSVINMVTTLVASCLSSQFTAIDSCFMEFQQQCTYPKHKYRRCVRNGWGQWTPHFHNVHIFLRCVCLLWFASLNL